MSGAQPQHDLLVQYWLRAIRIGIQATALVLLALGMLLLLPGDAEIRQVPFAAVLVTAAVGGLAVSLLPWHRLFDSPWGLRFLYAWSIADILLVSVGVTVSGGATSELFFAYALTTVFFGACYPRRVQPMLLAFTFACYLAALGVTGWEIGPAAVFLRLTVLGVLALVTSFLSDELLRRAHENLEARTNAELWAILLSSVASAGRSMTLDPQRVVEVSVASAIDLGFDGAALCLLDEEATTWRILHAKGLPQTYVRDHQVPYPVTQDMVGLVLRNGTTVTVGGDISTADDLALMREGFGALVATPVWLAGWMVGVLVGVSRRGTSTAPQVVEAFELLAAQAGLALENARRYEQEHQNVERLEELDRMKSDFLATVSHELRTPLTVVEGIGMTLELAWRQLDDQTRLELLGRLNANAKTLEGIITALLDFSRLETGHLEARFERIDLAEHLKLTAARLAGRSSGRDLSVDVDSELPVAADPILMDRVVENLLANAFVHTPAGTSVGLSAHRLNGEVTVAVTDDGQGIPQEELVHLGERFFRGGDLNTRPNGLGLGLALVREILDLHGSRLEVESRPGHGSRFSFTLPAVEHESGEHRTPMRT